MCGFTAFLNFPDLKFKINDLFKFIENRGPDKNTKLKIDNIQLLFSRLAIQDLTENGDQPIYSKSKNFIMLFNGEIYNHNEIRLFLNNKNPNILWSGTSDSETLVESFDTFGISKTLRMVRGMYSIFLYDLKEKKVFLINDIFGEKPLYYEINNDSFMVSSSLKSFVNKKNDINIGSLKELVTNNYICHPNTIYKNVYKLEPASIVSFKINEKINDINKKIYYDIKSNFKSNKNNNLEDLTIELEKVLFNAVENQLISDVPVGSFLSGGIDSTLITAIASKVSNKKFNTFTIGFENQKFNEATYAKKIAEFLGTNHHEKYLNKDNFLEIVDDVFNAYDEPFSDSSQIPTILLTKFCSTKVKVVLTGDGGDELFGGYHRYEFNPKFWKFLKLFPYLTRRIGGNLLSKNSNYLIGFIKKLLYLYNPKFKSVHYFDQKINQLLRCIDSKNLFEFSRKLSSHIDEIERDNFLFINNSEINKILKFPTNETPSDLMLFDVNSYLPGDLLVKVDRASMNYGLETRTPFLYREVFEFSRSIDLKYKVNNGVSKIILKNLLNKLVPQNLTDRPKQGFLLPINEILKNNSFKNRVDKIFNKEKINNQGFFKSEFVIKKWEEFKKGNHFDQYLIWDLIILQNWIDSIYMKE